jgi:hypothetical protein
MWVQGADVLDYLKDVLQRASTTPGALLPFWTSIATAGAGAAYWEIVQAFTDRGWGLPLIQQWDRGAEFQMDIAIWWCLEHGLAMDNGSYDAEALEPYKLDRRPELWNTPDRPGLMLTVGGVTQNPSQQTVSTTPFQQISQPTSGPRDEHWRHIGEGRGHEHWCD